jgi:DNA-binding NarL/FixJ family response regulator
MDQTTLSQQTPRTRILLVEDQAAIREMLADVLSQMPEFEIVAEADTFEQAIASAIRTQPDVVVLDWVFPGGGGGAFLRAMRLNRLRSHVLVLTGHTSEASVGEAVMAGARGFFEKGASLDDFIRALRTVAAGGAYFGPEAAGIVRQMVVAIQPALEEKGPAPIAAVDGAATRVTEATCTGAVAGG